MKYSVKQHLTVHKGSLTNKTAVALILIDNYDAAGEGMDDKEPLLWAVVERKLAALAAGCKGVLCKLEKDRYLLVFDGRELDALADKKFEILSQIREIDAGNAMPVTLSVGVGVNGENLRQSFEFAEAAADLALGRGGDQALVKNGDKYVFFGGAGGQAPENSRVRARVKAFAFSELVLEADSVIALGHSNMDLDCFGAAVGVFITAKFLGVNCKIVMGERRDGGVNRIYERISKEWDYGGVFIDEAEALELVTPKTLVVVVDTHRPSLIEFNSVLERAGAKRAVVFDHHRLSGEFVENSVLIYHEPYASSTCELLTEMIQYVKRGKDSPKLKPVEADALLAGITVDTKNFTFKTGSKTFDAAAFLRRHGADGVRVRLLLQSGAAEYKAVSEIVTSAEIYFGGAAIAVTDNQDFTVKAKAADELLCLSGVTASFVIMEGGGGARISARSLGEINAQTVMEKLGGGGHQTAAAAQMDGVSAQEAKERLIAVLRKRIEEGD